MQFKSQPVRLADNRFGALHETTRKEYCTYHMLEYIWSRGEGGKGKQEPKKYEYSLGGFFSL